MADSVDIPETIWNAELCKNYLPKPKSSDHKYSRGVLGCVTGSKEFPGAALLTTAAAIATGVGMVRYFGPREVRSEVIQNRAEVVLKKGKVDALLLGSGIGEKSSIFRKFALKKAAKTDVPRVLDAGALYLAGRDPYPTIITPHSGELGKLINVKASTIEMDRSKYAIETARKFKVTVLLKGSETIVTDGHRVINLPIATSWLATAGTGDVLAGVLGALIAINKSKLNHNNLVEIGATAALVNAMTAELINGPISPTLLIDYIPEVVMKLSK